MMFVWQIYSCHKSGQFQPRQTSLAPVCVCMSVGKQRDEVCIRGGALLTPDRFKRSLNQKQLNLINNEQGKKKAVQAQRPWGAIADARQSMESTRPLRWQDGGMSEGGRGGGTFGSSGGSKQGKETYTSGGSHSTWRPLNELRRGGGECVYVRVCRTYGIKRGIKGGQMSND